MSRKWLKSKKMGEYYKWPRAPSEQRSRASTGDDQCGAVTRSRVTDKDPDNGAWPGQAPAGGGRFRMSFYSLWSGSRGSAAAPHTHAVSRVYPGRRGVMFPSNVYNVRNGCVYDCLLRWAVFSLWSAVLVRVGISWCWLAWPHLLAHVLWLCKCGYNGSDGGLKTSFVAC